MRPLDVLFINADSSAAAYQELAKTYSAIEPPTWSLLLAQSCRSRGFGVAILDATAERLTHEQAVSRIAELNPRLACFVVYGQNPNSGTTNMIGNTECAALLKSAYPHIPICFVGSHTSALPLEVLSLPFVDFVLLNEGVYALWNLLATNLKEEAKNVLGIGHKLDGIPVLNPPEKIVPQERIDLDMPGYAWDLLPYKQKPLDLYRAHFWHAEFSHEKRTPFAAIYTSLGCKFKCDFCMINIVNRTDNSEGVSAANSPIMRFWSTDLILSEFEKLASMGVKTVRISDEMFFLNKKYYEPLVCGLIERGLAFSLWTYSRVDTVRKDILDKFLQAGIKWLALGIEAGNQTVRYEVSKGSFKDINIRDVIQTVRGAGINIISNFIVGLPDDNYETMRQTESLALELCSEMMNVYPCQALPGSPLYFQAKANGWKLPDSYAGYAFLSYESQPLPTKYLSAAEVLKFRDEMWHRYFTYPPYLELIERKFGLQERKNIEEMAKIRLKRKLLGD
ncbi:MAG: radical SAM protein [Chthoniobacterales bacterium]|nr:radical SAM protein [Chthoniobacterales bacterium]